MLVGSQLVIQGVDVLGVRRVLLFGHEVQGDGSEVGEGPLDFDTCPAILRGSV